MVSLLCRLGLGYAEIDAYEAMGLSLPSSFSEPMSESGFWTRLCRPQTPVMCLLLLATVLCCIVPFFHCVSFCSGFTIRVRFPCSEAADGAATEKTSDAAVPSANLLAKALFAIASPALASRPQKSCELFLAAHHPVVARGRRKGSVWMVREILRVHRRIRSGYLNLFSM
jgi:hypothetical protein